MADLLIHDVPDEDLELLDALATKLGLSRAEYLHGLLRPEERVEPVPVTVQHLAGFRQTFAALGDDDTMRSAWQ